MVRRKRYPRVLRSAPTLRVGEVYSSVVVRTSLGIAASRTAGCEKHKWDPQLYSSAEIHCDELMASQLMAWIDATHFTSSRATASTSTHNFALASKTLTLASKNLLDGASTALFDAANTLQDIREAADGDHTPLVGEYAFQAKFDRRDELHPKVQRRCEEFFV